MKFTTEEMETIYLSLCDRHHKCVNRALKAKTVTGKKYFDEQREKATVLRDKIRKQKGA